jgi:hypothetical protein
MLPVRSSLLLILPVCLLAQTPQSATGDAAAGKLLFTGERPFQNGGPACAACHSVAGTGFPDGGSMGPDLTRLSPRFGPEGMSAMLHSLFFPTMVPLFQDHTLAPQEEADLKAFFQSVASLPPPDYTLVFGIIALAGCAVLLAATWLIWRRRLRGVRRVLVEGAAGERP